MQQIKVTGYVLGIKFEDLHPVPHDWDTYTLEHKRIFAGKCEKLSIARRVSVVSEIEE